MVNQLHLNMKLYCLSKAVIMILHLGHDSYKKIQTISPGCPLTSTVLECSIVAKSTIHLVVYSFRSFIHSFVSSFIPFIPFVHPLQQCLKLDPQDVVCNYMHALAHEALGRYYNAIKGFTKVCTASNNFQFK